MIICFECSQIIKNKLDQLIKHGEYEDYSQAIASAIENLEMLHREISGKGSLVIDSKQDSPLLSSENIPGSSSKDGRLTQQPRPKSQKAKPIIPELFKKKDLVKPKDFAPLSDDKWSFEDAVPLNKWIFAMYNRLLPAKVNCRALAQMQTDLDGSVPYDQARSEISSTITDLGDYLKNYDVTNELNRDIAFATAFPLSGKGNDKSLERYLNQFLGYVNKEGNLESLLYSFKLINYEPSDNPRILLTEAGWDFANLYNPILDDEGTTKSEKFSSEEIGFLIQHISKNVPVEDYAYRTIIKSILDGNHTPSSIDGALKGTVKVEKGTKLTDSYLSSQRSGAISRMSDLDLIKRIRIGVTIKYEITERANSYIQCVK